MSTVEQPRNLASQGVVVASMTLLSRITGLVRDVFFAYLFGASHYADMFLVAFRIPNVFRRMFAEGAFNQAFVPVMMRYKAEGQAALLGFLAPLSGIFTAILFLIVLLGVVFAEQLTALFALGFSDQQISATAQLLVLTFPYLGLISLTAYAGALLNAHDRFAIPAVTPVLLNIVLIGATLIALMGYSEAQAVKILAYGVLVAGFVQLVFQMPALGRLGLLVRPTLEWSHPGLARIGKLLLPALFASSVSQINALVNTILASTLITGSISWLYYADRLLELPVGLVAIALGTVMLPHLSRLADEDDQETVHKTVGWGINIGIMLGLPAAVALYLLSEGLIATLYMSIGGGAMTNFDVRMAGFALEMFAIALPGFVLIRVLSTAFYAYEDTKSPFHYATVAVAANLLVSLATFSWAGHVGLAWATAISAWVNVVLLYRGLQRRRIYQLDGDLWRLLWRSLLASIVLGAALFLLLGDVDWLALTPDTRAWQILLTCAVGAVGYALVLLVLGVRPSDLNHYSVVGH
ncbi:MAG: murein biosynthesis integral membrane protein MurJ [Pseudomonadales bacterium]